jgi:hypothetical protein
MLTTIVVGAVCLLAGFGVGRIKNASKLAAIKAELDSVGQSLSAETYKVIAAIRAKL